jgi:5'-deoxynucleotidase YfbR-like HD superfamily hydrolase
MNAHCMQTYSGRVVDLSRFSEEDIHIEDIAHALSQIVRFTGHITKPYTVAQHSVLVSRLCPEEHALWGLLHDASEAYLGDVSTPLKSLLPEYREIEGRVQREIAGRFGLPWPMPASVKDADRRALMQEKRGLFSKQIEWPGEDDSSETVTTVLDPVCAKWVFIARLEELTK